MVTVSPKPSEPRKASAAPSAPYPLTPEEQLRSDYFPSNSQPSALAQTANSAAQLKKDDDELDDWEKEDPEDEEWEIEDKPEDMPPTLKPGGSQQPPKGAVLPPSLRPGPSSASSYQSAHLNSAAAVSQISLQSSTGYPSSLSLPREPTPLLIHNPYLQRNPSATTGEQIFGSHSSSSVWAQDHASAPVVYSDEPVELPASHTPTEEMSHLSFQGPSPPMEQPPLIPVETETYPPPNARHDSDASGPWHHATDVSSLDSTSRNHGLPGASIPQSGGNWQQQQDWEQREREMREREAHDAAQRAQQHQEQLRKAEDGPVSSLDTETPPPKPPRRKEDANEQLSRSQQRTAQEFYQIKHIRWYDATSGKLRTTPILTQSDNGPCPLLALVNALVLSTPDSETSGLVETLRTREQVTLGLLLSAVFDELMSGRRGGAAQDLPDVGELYEFLTTLHTGMNVNPMFTFKPDRRSMEIHPLMRPSTAPGGFEETKEMRLYSTFDIPLVHAWLPVRDSPEYEAFSRSAKTYEDAQNIQFGEEELDHKLSTIGLTPQEQQLFEDLHTIKDFLESWPTQLTDYGLKVLHEHIEPGSFLILFRNDHFSTIYKEPKAGQILTLVTDTGYSSHDEIIWESLVDVSGQGTEMFSGDFRPVSHGASSPTGNGPSVGPRNSSLGSQQQIQSMLDVGDESQWTTVQSGRGNRNSRRQQDQSASSPFDPQGLAPARPFDEPDDVDKSIQEDHDLALALQLQEEEEANARRESEARQREERLSRQLLDGGAPNRPVNRVNIPVSSGGGPQREQRPPQPPRPNQQQSRPLPPPQQQQQQQQQEQQQQQQQRQQQGGTTGLRPQVPPRRNRDDEDLPPPTYEVAALNPAFTPPADHPLSPNAPRPGRGAQSSSSQSTPGRLRPVPQGSHIRPMPQGNSTRPEDREKCVVM
jgi:hypothetical protein